jgi:hypothetical protein
MSSVAFDTHEAVSDIRKAGANEQLAEAIVRVVQRTADLPDISTLATKADLAALAIATKADLDALAIATKADLAALTSATKADLAALTSATKADFALVRADLTALAAATKGDLAALEARLDGKIATLDGKLTLLLWMIGVLGLGALIVPHLHLAFLN